MVRETCCLNTLTARLRPLVAEQFLFLMVRTRNAADRTGDGPSKDC